MLARLGRVDRAAPRIGGAAVIYFGPDAEDAAVRRRVAQWRHDGNSVLLLAFSRETSGRRAAAGFVSLGRVAPLSRLGRVLPLALAAARLALRWRMLASANLFIARNLDIALLALFVRWIARSEVPLIYEVLDINPSCTAPGWHGALIRWAERRVLASSDLLVVSSPYFATAYYERLLGCRPRWFLFENKVPKSAGPPPPDRAAALPATAAGIRRWRIGLFGYLDDERSWDILRRLAEALPDRVAVHVRGRPYTNFDMGRFLADVERLENVSYGGPYRNPEDLAEVYGAIDIVWSMDFNFPETNSKWLLTNGLYEAGYFGKPVLGLRGTALGEALERSGSGWCIEAPVADTIIDFIRGLTVAEYEAKRQQIIRQDPACFVETDEIKRLRLMLCTEAPQPRRGWIT
jgi:succinoglycan biosynthesis protein ExoL